VTIVSMAFLPQPPVLLPGMTGRPVAEVETLRQHCRAALGMALADGPDELVVVGSRRPDELEPAVALRVARTLLEDAGVELPLTEVVLPTDVSEELIGAAAATIAHSPGRRALLVMGDGSACRTLKAPGYLDERAEPFDAAVSAALANADAGALAALDRTLATELLVAGWVPWQVAAVVAGDRDWRPVMLETADPFGVFYPVAVWLGSESST